MALLYISDNYTYHLSFSLYPFTTSLFLNNFIPYNSFYQYRHRSAYRIQRMSKRKLKKNIITISAKKHIFINIFTPFNVFNNFKFIRFRKVLHSTKIFSKLSPYSSLYNYPFPLPKNNQTTFVNI